MNLLIIKVVKNSDIHSNLKKYSANEYYFYHITNKNIPIYNKIYGDLDKKDSLDTIFIIHENNIPQQVYITKSQKFDTSSNSNPNIDILCDTLFFSDKKTIIEQFLLDINFDLASEFDKGIYITCKPISSSTYLEFKNKLFNPYVIEGINPENQNYKPFDIEKSLDLNLLAQKNEYCIRPLAIQSPDNNRSEFQRDRERIIHTKAYRRLVDKAQIFTSNKGDHFRTRLTHTLEVSQIARGIAQRLRLNPDLTEAIAIGHDIGHTPFGHQGERTLDDILKGKIKLIPSEDDLDIGGFKHNYQSLRVLTFIEEKYIEHDGIDLSYQTLEGILKHTKCKDDFDIKQFLIGGDEKYLFMDKSFSTTLEGQVVKIADEIAQRGHDLDDSFASGILNFDSFKLLCDVKYMDPIIEIVEDIKCQIDEYKNKRRIIIDETDTIRAILSSKVLGYLINDVITESEIRMKKYINRKIEYFNQNHRVDEELISFSTSGKLVAEYLEKIISKNVINSFEVSRFDSKSALVIKKLFEAYYNNPRLLPDNMLKRLNKESYRQNCDFPDFRSYANSYLDEEIKDLTQITIRQNTSSDLKQEYKMKRKILARCIADYIGGMTDNYALNEYSKLYESFSGHI
ncbi:deoxyguanosinetriphosphate triphosphohydrolase family protein [Tissierella praeacuta]|uniref:deoxyguanosinetriphosphate triphosphohydrolase family protein n=1 Tax=Tissierella praeacuta TaxID=43131 RepID=UPI003DA2937B